MSERKTMKTFFAAMNEQIGMGGYGSKIKSTPMGPFKWNDLMQLWENVNNGMVMSNVSLQDMMAMDYGTSSGDSDNLFRLDYTPSLSPVGLWGNLGNMGSQINKTVWSNSSGGNALIANAQAVTFSGINTTITIQLTAIPEELTSPLANIKYSIDSDASITTYAGTFTITNGQTLKIAGTTPPDVAIPGSGIIRVQNVTDGNAILADISYIFG